MTKIFTKIWCKLHALMFKINGYSSLFPPKAIKQWSQKRYISRRRGGNLRVFSSLQVKTHLEPVFTLRISGLVSYVNHSLRMQYLGPVFTAPLTIVTILVKRASLEVGVTETKTVGSFQSVNTLSVFKR